MSEFAEKKQGYYRSRRCGLATYVLPCSFHPEKSLRLNRCDSWRTRRGFELTTSAFGGQRSPYRLGFDSVLKTLFTMDSDIRRVRAIATGFMPAWCEALIKLTLPAGIAVAESSSRRWPLGAVAVTAG